MKGTIAIIRMYSGNYLNDNLGHEIINLFISDDGKHFVYATPADLGKEDVVNAFFVYYLHGTGMAEVIGCARGLKVVNLGSKDSDNICYGGKTLKEIFSKDTFQDLLVSYEAENVYTPSKPLYIKYTEKDIARVHNSSSKIVQNISDVIDLKYTKVGQHLTSYVSNVEDCESLNRVLNDNSIWIECTSMVDRIQLKTPKRTFMEICNKENDEVAYSNAIAHFLRKYPELLCAWMKLHKIELTSANIKIERESERIDLLIYDENNIIVVENKILSGINGINGISCQLDSYWNAIMNRSNGGNLKYLPVGATANFFVLVPDYYDERRISLFDEQKHYEIIKYSELFGICNDFVGFEPYCHDEYFVEFVEILQKHARPRNDSIYIEMKRRFYERIFGK